MNWQAWIWPRQRTRDSQVDELKALLERERAARKVLERTLAFRRPTERMADAGHSISHALMFVDENDPQWLAIHRLINIMDSEEQVLALRPSMDSDERAYNNGRAAAVADVRAMLLQQWSKARIAQAQQ
jgi:hypothetical protein